MEELRMMLMKKYRGLIKERLRNAIWSLIFFMLLIGGLLDDNTNHVAC